MKNKNPKVIKYFLSLSFMPSVDSIEAFQLHKVWNDARLAGDDATAAQALAQLGALGHNPFSTGRTPEQLREDLLHWERRRLRFQHRLRSYSMHTLIGPKLDGKVSETSGAMLLNTKGRGRCGQSAGANGQGGSDLVDGTEVKEAARCFVNIDLIFTGIVVRRGTHVWLRIDRNSTNAKTLEQLEGNLSGVMNQIASNGLTVQRLNVDGTCDSSARWKTCTGGAIIQVGTLRAGQQGLREWDKEAGIRGEWSQINLNFNRRTFGNQPLPEDGTYIRLGQGQWQLVNPAIVGVPFEYRITQERAHFNLGKRSGNYFAQMLAGGVLFASRHIDLEGRCAVAFVYLKTNSLDDANQLMLRRQRPLEDTYQFQPYLFADNTRHELYDNPANGLMNLGGRLLALYLEDENDLQEMYWNPNGGLLTDQVIQALLTTSQTGRPLTYPGAGGNLGAPRPITDYDLQTPTQTDYDHNNTNHRNAMLDVFSEELTSFYRDSRYFTDWTNTCRKIFSGKEGEVLAALYSGLRGDRSMARGTDLYENNGLPSESKQVTGQQGDEMFTIDSAPPLHLGRPGNPPGAVDGPSGIFAWNRLFITRIEDRSPNLGLHIALQIQCANPVLHQDAADYSVNYPDSTDLQYHCLDYASRAYGHAGRRMYLTGSNGGQIIPPVVYEFCENGGRQNYDANRVLPCP
jgi:Txe/YoeB family toxin of Txe-Axe toxin-antitoxin module